MDEKLIRLLIVLIFFIHHTGPHPNNIGTRGHAHVLRPLATGSVVKASALGASRGVSHRKSRRLKGHSLVCLAALLGGCVSNGPMHVQTDFTGKDGQAIVRLNQKNNGNLSQLAAHGAIFGFDGLMSGNMRYYLEYLIDQHLPRMHSCMVVADPSSSNRLLQETVSSGGLVIVCGYSNNNSFFGQGGWKGFLERLKARHQIVDLLILFDDTWGGKIPSNVRGVINIYTGNGLGSRKLTPDRLEDRNTWIINLYFPDLSHIGLPLPPERTDSAYEHFTSNVYTQGILVAIEYLDGKKAASTPNNMRSTTQPASPILFMVERAIGSAA